MSGKHSLALETRRPLLAEPLSVHTIGDAGIHARQASASSLGPAVHSRRGFMGQASTASASTFSRGSGLLQAASHGDTRQHDAVLLKQHSAVGVRPVENIDSDGDASDASPSAPRSGDDYTSLPPTVPVAAAHMSGMRLADNPLTLMETCNLSAMYNVSLSNDIQMRPMARPPSMAVAHL